LASTVPGEDEPSPHAIVTLKSAALANGLASVKEPTTPLPVAPAATLTLLPLTVRAASATVSVVLVVVLAPARIGQLHADRVTAGIGIGVTAGHIEAAVVVGLDGCRPRTSHRPRGWWR